MENSPTISHLRTSGKPTELERIFTGRYALLILGREKKLLERGGLGERSDPLRFASGPQSQSERRLDEIAAERVVPHDIEASDAKALQQEEEKKGPK